MNDNLNRKKVVALGKFDGMHIGHVKLLEMAVKIAKKNNALSMVCFIGSARQSLADEVKIQTIAKELGVDLLERQDLTPGFKNMSAEEFVSDFLCKKLNCSHVVTGYNFRFAKGRSAGVQELSEICTHFGMECIVIPEVSLDTSDGKHTVSSSYIRELISNGDIKNTNLCLGREYSISGTVVHGKHLGTELDFPTANIIPPKELSLLSAGVYVTKTDIGKKTYPSVTNIGNNPTVSDDNAVTVETHILGFDGDIYGKEITVRFFEKIRGEIKFDSFEALKAQVDKDKAFANNYENIKNQK